MLTLAAILALLALAMLLLGEAGVRLVGGYDPFEMNFYAKHSHAAGVYETPYGLMRTNAHGFPDEEFDLTDPRPRVGYFGDSVTFGLGAGHGHRITDHLRAAFPAFQHMTFGKVGGGLQASELRLALDLVERFGVDRYVYLMNLNDLLPATLEGQASEPQPFLRRLKHSPLFQALDQLRMHSHLYNFVRTRVRNAIAQRGFSHQGYEAYELWPRRYASILDEVTGRIDELNRRLAERGVVMCIALLPYEMQVSREAEAYYAGLGFRWEEGFVSGTTQRMIRERLDPALEVVDLREAFVADGRSPDENALGEYFIARAGGAIDWDHPNRAGHRLIADFLIARGFCGLGRATSPPARAPSGSSRSARAR